MRVWVWLLLAAVGCQGQQPTPEAAPESAAAPEPPAPAPAKTDVPAAAPVEVLEPETVSDDPPTGLPLALLATLAADEPGQGRATLRDEKRGVIANHRAGELIANKVRLLEVWPDYVVINNNDERERVSFAEGIASVAATDVFYPDFVELEDQPNSMNDALQLEDGPGYVVKKPVFAWGTPRTIAAIRQAIRTYAAAVDGGPDVRVGDISKRNGGPFPPHLSHQTGRDVDIGYILSGPQKNTRRFVTATRHSLDRARSWALLRAMLETDAVRYMFVDYGLQKLLYDHAIESGEDPKKLATIFQYPAGSRAARGIIRHWRGHGDHFHVRFRG